MSILLQRSFLSSLVCTSCVVISFSPVALMHAVALSFLQLRYFVSPLTHYPIALQSSLHYEPHLHFLLLYSQHYCLNPFSRFSPPQIGSQSSWHQPYSTVLYSFLIALLTNLGLASKPVLGSVDSVPLSALQYLSYRSMTIKPDFLGKTVYLKH